MSLFNQAGTQAGTSSFRGQRQGPDVGAPAPARSSPPSSPSSGSSSPTGTPRRVTLHTQARPAAPSTAQRLGARRVSAVPVAAPASLAQGLSQVAAALEDLAYLSRRARVSPTLVRWSSEAWGRMNAFLDGVQRAEQTALLGGMESLEGRAERRATLDTLARQLDTRYQALEASLRAMPPLPTEGSALQALRAPGLRQACASVLAHTVDQMALRYDFLASSEQHHAFYLPRMLQSKILYWQAAGEVLRSLQPGTPLAFRQGRLPARPTPTPSPSPSRPSATPPRGSGEREAGASEAGASQARTREIGPREAGPRETRSRRAAARQLQFFGPPRAAEAHVPSLLGAGGAGAPPARPSTSASPSSQSRVAGARADAQALLGQYLGRFDGHVRDLSRLAETAERSPGQRLLDPGEVLGLKGKARRAEVNAAVDAMLEGTWRPGIRNPLMPERELVLACLDAAVARAREADPALPLPSARALAAQYEQACSRQLALRPNAVVRSQLLLPATGEAVRALGRPVLQQLQAASEQRPAIAVTQALQAAYLADGVQGAHCHDRSQHKHCTNLYLSRFESGSVALPGQRAGQSLLTLTRHGVLSPLGLSRRALAADAKGRPQISDEALGRAALDLAEDPGVDAPALRHLRDEIEAGTKSASEAWAEAAREVRQDAQRGGWARRAPAFLGGGQQPLIDRLHAAAGLRRAQEAAEVALASLPDEVLADIARQAAQGHVPVVRLASVSLLTPDPFRNLRGHLRDNISDDELAMWRDQRQAWETLARRPRLVPLPVLDARGRVQRDEEGRLLTTRPDGSAARGPVRFQVLPMNVPVNETATSVPTGGFAATRGANRQAIETLLGRDLLGWTHWPRDPGRIRGWVGEALRALDPARATSPAEKRAVEARRQTLIALSLEITRLYMTNAHHSAGADPYKLAKRLIVLCSLLPGTATLINCKSGKDRTSEAEAQARHLALEIALREGRPPAADEALTPVRQAQLAVLHEAGGSREIQWWNTNMAGTKLGGQALMAMYGIRDKSFFTPRKVYEAVAGKDPARASYVGASKLTKS